jgi:sterol desaturase/sphingolipid hydroxylase (fatty acid hydroxylase superfamily)
MAFHPIEALTGAVVIPLLVFVIPIHPAALAVVLSIMTVMGVTNHMGWEVFPAFMWRGRWGAWLITASHHQRHHEYYRGNYGLYFRFWDRLCGTDRGLGDFAARHARAACPPGGRPGDGGAAAPARRDAGR